MRSRRSGYSFVELLVVFALIALLTGIAIPRYRDIKRRAIATQAINDFGVLRVASFNYFADKGTFPADAPAGTVPPDLISALPEGFTLANNHYSLDFDSYQVVDPLTPSGATHVLSVTLNSTNTALVRQVALSMNPGNMGLSIGNTFTYIITGL